MEFNYEGMEEELTCPVCLELYADPLILPCSHSLCKKCLEEILSNRSSANAESEGFRCPSCRKTVDLTNEKIHILPKNLALENIVIRFTEERSKSKRKSLTADWPFSDTTVSLASSVVADDEGQLDSAGGVASSSRSNCGLCESTTSPNTSDWYCVQCDVAYCQFCFIKYHPCRGALARHRILPPKEKHNDNSFNCTDHEQEQASMFCDRCKVYVCHLCVCDGEGRHSGHKMLAPDTACIMVKTLADKTKEQSDSLLASLRDERNKIEVYYQEIKVLHDSSVSRIEQQYKRFIEDLTSALLQEKSVMLQRMNDIQLRLFRQTDSQKSDNDRCCNILTELSRGCEDITQEKTTSGILARASELQPLIVKIKKHKKEVGFLHRRYESMLKDKSVKLQLLSGTEQFRKRFDKLVSWFLDDGISGSDSIIPHIMTIVPPGKNNLIPRIQNKYLYLTNWGAPSTSFTGDSISCACSWTVTIESNCNIWDYLQTGYLFGIGVSGELLNAKDLVGVALTSQGLICTGGDIVFMHAGKQEMLTNLGSLPLNVTIAIKFEQPDVMIFTYKLASVAEGKHISLVGRKIMRDVAFKKAIYPVFTVSQKIKILFPTYV